MKTTAISSFKVEYFGQAAHAAANPWLGINALDGLVSGYNNFSMLRQQTRPGDIIHGYISDGGVASNIIHAYAAGLFGVRSETQARTEALRDKVYDCFQAGSLASGAKVVITSKTEYKDMVSNRPLGKAYSQYFNALNPPVPISENQDKDAETGTTQASTDQGDISYAMPSISPLFTLLPTPHGQGPHNPEFAEVAGTVDAYQRAVRVAKSLAGVALECLNNPKYLQQVKESWKNDMRRVKMVGGDNLPPPPVQV